MNVHPFVYSWVWVPGPCAGLFSPPCKFPEQVEGSVASWSSRGCCKRMGNRKVAGWTVRCPSNGLSLLCRYEQAAFFFFFKLCSLPAPKFQAIRLVGISPLWVIFGLPWVVPMSQLAFPASPPLQDPAGDPVLGTDGSVLRALCLPKPLFP